jgi:hypothetical protein
VCRLYSRETYEGRKQHSNNDDGGGGGEWHGGGGMAAYATPELMRVPLEVTISKVDACLFMLWLPSSFFSGWYYLEGHIFT